MNYERYLQLIYTRSPEKWNTARLAIPGIGMLNTLHRKFSNHQHSIVLLRLDTLKIFNEKDLIGEVSKSVL